MVAATDLTASDDATQVVPGSHQWDHNSRTAKPDEITLAAMQAVSAVFILGKTLHGGGTIGRRDPGTHPIKSRSPAGAPALSTLSVWLEIAGYLQSVLGAAGNSSKCDSRWNNNR